VIPAPAAMISTRVSLHLSVISYALREHMDALRVWTQRTSADPVAHSLARLESVANDFQDMNEQIPSAVVGCDKAETRLTVKPLDGPVVDRIHRLQYRFDIEVLGNHHL
jgi:hypothetical protein